MAAKAFILSAFISLLAHRQMASTHMRRKPMARSPMYMNSLITESHRTPEREQEKSFDGATGLRSICSRCGLSPAYLVSLQASAQ